MIKTHRIVWTNRSQKDLRKISQQGITNILMKIELLKKSRDEWGKQVKKLINHQYDYRLRVGEYRVVFDLEKVAKIISIEKVGKRDGNTY